ncbi:MAG: sigma 54-interacting transcriptional regulator [Tissierellia bacterium]|nr:sigma 54-interacting transcriptional regulator [Tissierellia bacterium]
MERIHSLIELLQHDQELLDMVLNRLNDGIMISDEEGRIVAYNKAMEKVENMDRREMIGRFLWDAYGYDGESHSEHRHVFKTGKALENVYSAHTAVDGEPLYTIYSTYPIQKDGNTIGVVTISGNEQLMHDRLIQATESKRQHNVNYNLSNGRIYSENGTTYSFADFIGESDQIVQLIKEAQTISWLDNSILIVGDTGTGKEVLAQSIHNHGKRLTEPFIGVNCGAIPLNLLESILFGTVKGAYTGAVDHTGLFEEARGGTVFLDEINSMPLQLQVKLLRVLQEKRANRVGDNKSFELKCRVISAMNMEPMDAVREGRLREDLYYRLAGFTLHIPALTKRPRDIVLLIEYFARRYAGLMDKSIIGIDDSLKKILLSYTWPGNVRELENLVENMLILADPDEKYLKPVHIPRYMQRIYEGVELGRSVFEDERSLTEKTEEFERGLVIEALESSRYNISHAAKKLGILRQNLLYRMKKYGIQKPEV